jgi:hypothetical protein
VFLEWMDRLTWVIENDGEYFLEWVWLISNLRYVFGSCTIRRTFWTHYRFRLARKKQKRPRYDPGSQRLIHALLKPSFTWFRHYSSDSGNRSTAGDSGSGTSCTEAFNRSQGTVNRCFVSEVHLRIQCLLGKCPDNWSVWNPGICHRLTSLVSFTLCEVVHNSQFQSSNAEFPSLCEPVSAPSSQLNFPVLRIDGNSRRLQAPVFCIFPWTESERLKF